MATTKYGTTAALNTSPPIKYWSFGFHMRNIHVGIRANIIATIERQICFITTKPPTYIKNLPILYSLFLYKSNFIFQVRFLRFWHRHQQEQTQHHLLAFRLGEIANEHQFSS